MNRLKPAWPRLARTSPVSMIKRLLALLLLASMLALPAAHAQPTGNHTGTWVGRTAQGQTFTLVVEGRTIQAIIVRVKVQGGEPDYCTGDVFFLGSDYTTGMHYLESDSFDFVWQDRGATMHIRGFFGPTEVQGDFELITDERELCEGRAQVSWRAQRDGTRPDPAPAPGAPPPPTPAPPPAPGAPPPPTPTPNPNDPPPPPTPTPIAPPAEGALVIEGAGRRVIDPFTLSNPINRVTATYSGISSFVVSLYGSDGTLRDLLFGEVGAYSGQTLLADDTGLPYLLEIDTVGNWQLVIEPVPLTDEALLTFRGRGDVVSDLFEPGIDEARTYRVTHNGTSTFLVYLRCADRDDLVANTIGPEDGETVVTFEQGPCLWEVEADGDWTLEPQ